MELGKLQEGYNKIMKSKYYYFWVSFYLLFLSSCDTGGDNGGVPFTGATVNDIVGNWEVTQAQFTTVNANPAQETEVIALGATGTLAVASDGRFTLVITPSGENPQITTGQFGVVNDMLSVVFDYDPGTTVFWSIQSSNTAMFLVGPIKYDFENDGDIEDATVELDLVKN